MKKLYGLIECCLNWRVIAGLALVGGALFLFAPKLATAYLPVLLALICPISMLVMMLSMGRMNMIGRGARVQEPTSASEDLSRDQQLQLLEERLERIQQRHRSIASQVAAAVASRTARPDAARSA